MSFSKLCKLEDVWEGEMEVFEKDGHEILVAHLQGGNVVALQANCPHQDIPLSEGKLENGVLTCRAHLWQFEIASGLGINPTGCELARYPVRIEGDDILVDVQGIVPKHSAG